LRPRNLCEMASWLADGMFAQKQTCLERCLQDSKQVSTPVKVGKWLEMAEGLVVSPGQARASGFDFLEHRRAGIALTRLC
jgi:hypothetical protein